MSQGKVAVWPSTALTLDVDTEEFQVQKQFSSQGPLRPRFRGNASLAAAIVNDRAPRVISLRAARARASKDSRSPFDLTVRFLTVSSKLVRGVT